MMSTKLFRTFAIILLLVLSLPAHASEAMLKRFFSEVQTLQAHFTQTVVDDSGMTLQSKEGLFSFSRPGKFRWNYDSQDPDIEIGEQIVSDGKIITFYEPDLETATQRSMANALVQVPTLLLVQSGQSLEKHFNVTDIGKTDGLTWVALRPKDENAGYRELMVGFYDQDLNAIILNDDLGNETRLSLNRVNTNLSLKDELFDFVAGPGVDVISQ